MRLLVWQSADGKVLVGYPSPPETLDRYGPAGQQEAIEIMTKVHSDIAHATPFSK
jgi:uncharacterized protein (DUF302 family)